MEINEQFEIKKDNLITDNKKEPLSLRKFLLFSLILFTIIFLIFLFFNFSKEEDSFKKKSKQFKNDIYLNNIKAHFDINDINSPTKIINEPVDSLKIKLFIDGEEKDFNTFYQFKKIGDIIL